MDTSAPHYWFYFFHSSTGRQRIESIIEQVAAAGIRGKDLSNLLIPVAPLPTQKAIAHILGTLDDKIELLRSMNETLEAMARALFKSWFIDFDPVRKKEVGQPTGLPPEIDALFPDSFEDSELGEIPKGWTAEPFSNQITLLGGGTPKTSVTEYWQGSIPWYSVVDTPRKEDVFVIDTEKHITEDAINNSSTRLLPIGTTIISARGTVGNLALTAFPMCMNQSCYGVRWNSDGGDSYIFFSLVNIVDSLKGMAHGSVFDTITRSTFESIKSVKPKEQVVRAYENEASKSLSLIKSNLLEINFLTRIRDSLLPKLISGDLELSDQMINKILEPAK